MIHQYAKGIDDDPVAEKNPLIKDMETVSLCPGIFQIMKPAVRVLLSLCETVGARLGLRPCTLWNSCVELRDWSFKTSPPDDL